LYNYTKRFIRLVREVREKWKEKMVKKRV
jgi:hypothetical protein